MMEVDPQHQVPTAHIQENETEMERDNSKSPIQEIEEESFAKVELYEGLRELNEAMKHGDSKEINSCFTNLTKTFPTAVRLFSLHIYI